MAQPATDEAIYQYVKKLSSATLADIGTTFDISESTVRRALARLEKLGWLRRFRGGAIALTSKATFYDRRLQDYYAEKEAIACKAAEQVKDGSNIILLGGTTVSAMCRYLHGKKISVITNSLTVIDQLKGSSGIELIALGGVYNHDEYEFVGTMTNIGLRFMRADSLFLSCVGFSPDTGFTTNHIDAVEFYRLCMKNANKTFVLTDSSKAEYTGIAVFAGVHEIDCLITDTGLAQETIQSFNETQIEVCITKQLGVDKNV